jgi:hypothetical protein
VIGEDGVVLGSDWNGGVRHLSPSSGTGTSLDATAGLWNIGQSHELWGALTRSAPPKRHAAVSPAALRFLNAWDQVFKARRR